MLTAGDNPFRVERLHNLEFQLTGETWDGLCARLESLGFRAAVVGPHGHGKTTFLRSFARRLEARGFGVRRLFLSEEHPHFEARFLRELARTITERDILFLDGAEQLGWLAWRRFLRTARGAQGILITCHRPMHFPTLLECRTSPELLAALLRDLDVERCLPPDFDLGKALAERNGSIRDVFFALYDRLARE